MGHRGGVAGESAPAADWCGTVEYGRALAMQEAARISVLAGGPGQLFGLEHPPVVTLGRRGGEVDADRAARCGYAVWRTRRGGLATCHEPGQLVGYLIVDARELGVRDLVDRVEGALIGWLGQSGVPAARRPGFPGVWVATDAGFDKIAAVGMHFRHGVSMHGFALNLRNDLEGFSLISPCGIVDGGVTSLQRVLGGVAPSPYDAWLSLAPVLTSPGFFAKPRSAPGT